MAKDVLLRFEAGFKRFAYTDFYLFAFAAIVFIGWVAESAVFGFVALVLLASLALVVLDDSLPLLAPLFYAMCMIFTDQVDDFAFMWPCFIPLALALVVFFVRNKRRFRRGAMFFPQLAVSVVLLLGGVGVCTAEEYLRALPNALTLGFLALAVYMLVTVYSGRDEKRDLGLYFGKILMWLGFIVLAEVVVWYIRADIPPAEWGSHARNYGWGIENNAATILSLTAPMCFFLATRYRNGGIYAVLGLLQYVGIVLTFSRGGILMAVFTGPVSAVFALVKAVDKKRMGITYAVTAAAVAVCLGVLHDSLGAAMGSLLGQGFGSNGRAPLYDEAIALFREHPFLGVGLGYSGPNFDINTMQFYWFHCTFLQIIANMGIVGLVVYAVYYVARFRAVLGRLSNPFNLFTLIAWLGFEGYSMMDTGTFVGFPTMSIVLATTAVLELAARGRRFEGEVDEYNRTFRRWGVSAKARYYDAFTPAYTRASESL